MCGIYVSLKLTYRLKIQKKQMERPRFVCLFKTNK